MIIITSPAQQRIAQLYKQHDNQGSLRISVAGGGCSGFQYHYEWSKEKWPDDYEYGNEDAKLRVDAISMQYMWGSTIDFETSLMESHFTIDNPNATTKCGCGESFTVEEND